MATGIVTQSELRELFDFQPETGRFIRLKTVGNQPAGSVAGAVRPRDGYIQIAVRRKIYQAHRLAWFYVHGAWPKEQIDHINGNPGDNRLCNLREATRYENAQNLHGANARNKAGLLGVSRNLHYDLWRARIMKNGKVTTK